MSDTIELSLSPDRQLVAIRYGIGRSKNHLVYFPVENVDGHPVLRIMRPVD